MLEVVFVSLAWVDLGLVLHSTLRTDGNFLFFTILFYLDTLPLYWL